VFAGYAWWLRRKYQNVLDQANDGARIWKTAFENTALGMAVVTPEFKYIDINKAYGDIIGYSKDELFTMIHKDFIHPEDREIDTPYVVELYAGKLDSFRTTKRYIHKKGHIVWSEATVSLVRDEKGKPKFYVTQIQDITSAKNAERALQEAKDKAEYLACTDFLTECLNRRAFVLRLQEEMERVKRNSLTLSLILVDIDSFKGVNDQWGHLAGDYTLQQFSQSLKQNVRAYDFIGRFGGEEFIICLPDTDAEKASAVAERMRRSVEELEIDYLGSRIKITGSFGVACYHGIADETIDQLIYKADQAMYTAKKSKNWVYSWE
jgi:diguanylate cyclase (GGDEF)-like protein/PAS domain S-box-containing protein